MDLRDAIGVAPAGEGGVEKGPKDGFGVVGGREPRTEGEDVQVVVLPRQPRALGVGDGGRAYAGYLVGGNRHPDAAAAHQKAAVEEAFCHAFRDTGREVGIVHRAGSVGAEIVVGDAEAVEHALQRVLQLESRVIGAKRDSHRRGLYYREVSTPFASLSIRGEERVRLGHPWIYRSDVVKAEAEPGAIVQVKGPRGKAMGRALFSDRSQITLRMLTREDVEIDQSFWRARLASAIGFRESLGIDATAFRLVHAEADLLPSLIVDRYGDHLVLQALSQGMDRLTPALVPILSELTGAHGVLARNDPKVRQLEGLEQSVELLAGEVPERIQIRDGAIEYDVDPWKGQKTGLFLDQRENREAAARYAHGRVLDAFSYHGGFALALAPKASTVEALDVSAEAVAQIAANAARNGLTNVEAREVNVFDELRRLERDNQRYDTIVLDPPAFAKSKASVVKALSGYKEINLRALRLLRPGGYLVTCSCSYNVDEATFGQVLYEASVDSHVPVTVVEKRMQARDHPVLLGVPETYYLKCLILRKAG